MYTERTDFHINFGLFIFSSQGIEFDHEGDEIVWLWWWKRCSWKQRFLSIGFGGVFESIKEIDNLWLGYWEAEARCIEKEQDYR